MRKARKAIDVATRNGPMTLMAEVYGALAVHIPLGEPSHCRMWQITHVPSGYSIARLYETTRAHTIEVLRALQPLCDWSRVIYAGAGKVPGGMTVEQLAAARAVIAEAQRVRRRPWDRSSIGPA